MVARVSKLVARHHTYDNVDGLDCQILLEVDFLVNADEEQLSQSSILSIRQKVFRTATGIRLLEEMFCLPDNQR